MSTSTVSNIAFIGVLASIAAGLAVHPAFFILALPLGYATWAPALWELRRKRLARLANLSKHQELFDAIMALLAIVAKADGQVSRAEIRFVENFMRKELQVGRKQRKRGVAVFRAAKGKPEVFGQRLSYFSNQIQDNRFLSLAALDLLVRIASVDPPISAAEEELLQLAASEFEIDKSIYRHIRRLAAKSESAGEANASSEQEQQNSKQKPDDAQQLLDKYSLLGCKPSDSDEQIRKRYVKLVKKYHPDKHSSGNLPASLVQMAEEKFKAVQSAYDDIMESRPSK